ncbi:MAG TPA: hypothetical protein VJ343_01975 [archaeon]|nr:hypothetical protein [archaeon]
MEVKILLLILVVFILFISSSLAANPDIVVINLNSTQTWWNDSILVNGVATYSNGNPISGSSVSVKLDGVANCTTSTLPNGNYNCSFFAPLNLGTYTVSVNVTNSTGSSFTNSTSLTVKMKYGQVPIGKSDRMTYEQPMLIQDISGKIKVVWARITVWRG